jgi:hypothetical protein
MKYWSTEFFREGKKTLWELLKLTLAMDDAFKSAENEVSKNTLFSGAQK